MEAGELKAGRAFGVTFQHGDEFMASLVGFRRENEVRQGSPFAHTGTPAHLTARSPRLVRKS
jgi:hypothetical protein